MRNFCEWLEGESAPKGPVKGHNSPQDSVQARFKERYDRHCLARPDTESARVLAQGDGGGVDVQTVLEES